MPQQHRLPDPALPPADERLPASWTSTMPQATERMQRTAADRVAWLVALAVLVFMAVFGFQAMHWSLAGGWRWLWMLVGLPFFGVFSVLSVLAVVTRLRERRRVRVTLENMSLERGEGFRTGEPLELRLRATVPIAREGERTVAPEHIAMHLVRRFMLDAADGTRSLVEECCDEAIAPREDARAGRVVYACELRAKPANGDEAAQWSVELREAADGTGEPLLVAALRLLPPR
ncbi:hypothetical protein ABL840_03090 [Variovorax sp. NFACC27]|uniref:hypothetical protein n=1 Tax=unclassified Variovorax TaxID=663243 RepID=UPI00089B66FE|nr:hypothetical protein SAMN03159371_02279 [Variovorax sp. NFACC28]SEG49829.1 hypothetical protein SAMN03159365_02360 [Variovorax sp. NFACC29]SFC21713.1 hypothetical protein SAMN03159379_01750 [Variovorax sp. NFACC26]SFH09023.1 hypothetical protein SAMN03159447_06564 [Variovorax sp. NFACC27]